MNVRRRLPQIRQFIRSPSGSISATTKTTPKLISVQVKLAKIANHDRTVWMESTRADAGNRQTSLSSRVRESLKSSGISLSEAARIIGVEPSKLSKSLAGTRKFRVEEISQLAALTDVTTDWLATGRGSPSSRRRSFEQSLRAMPRMPGTENESIESSPVDLSSASTSSNTSNDLSGSMPNTDDRWLSKGKRNRRRIVATAWQLYADKGIDNVRTHDIAEEIGLTASAINYHFKTKTALLEAALRYSLEIIASTRDLTNSEDPLAALRHFARVHAGVDLKVRRVWSIWLQSWAKAVVDERSRINLAAVYGEWLNMILGVIEAGQANGAIRQGDSQRMVKSLSIFIDGLGVARSTGQMPITDGEALDMLEDYLSAHILDP